MNIIISAIRELLNRYYDDSIVETNDDIRKGLDRKEQLFMLEIDKSELSRFEHYNDLPCELPKIVELRYSNRKYLRANLDFFVANSVFPYRCSFSKIPISKDSYYEKKGIIVANFDTGFCKTNDYGNYKNKYAIDELWLLEDLSFLRTQFLETVGFSSPHYFVSANRIGLNWKRNTFTSLAEMDVGVFLPESYEYCQYLEYLKEDNHVASIEIHIDRILFGIYGDSIRDDFKYSI